MVSTLDLSSQLSESRHLTRRSRDGLSSMRRRIRDLQSQSILCFRLSEAAAALRRFQTELQEKLQQAAMSDPGGTTQQSTSKFVVVGKLAVLVFHKPGKPGKQPHQPGMQRHAPFRSYQYDHAELRIESPHSMTRALSTPVLQQTGEVCLNGYNKGPLLYDGSDYDTGPSTSFPQFWEQQLRPAPT